MEDSYDDTTNKYDNSDENIKNKYKNNDNVTNVENFKAASEATKSGHYHPSNSDYPDEHHTPPSSPTNKHSSSCTSCGKEISDYYLLAIGPDKHFHVDCLSCFECGENLEGNKTCFIKEERFYCKKDYEK